jgi:hypothetical protein
MTIGQLYLLLLILVMVSAVFGALFLADGIGSYRWKTIVGVVLLLPAAAMIVCVFVNIWIGLGAT